jgi:hypothetical protein
MRFSWQRAIGLAALLYAGLFALALATEWQRHGTAIEGTGLQGGAGQDAFANARKNYASFKQAATAAPAGQPIGDAQKYEKIASLTQRTTDFEADRARADAAIGGHGGIVQVERGSGLKGRRVLHLGIGVPPDRFDAFIAAVRGIGATASITTVKNDRTNEYLQLRAKRASLEKARAKLEALQGSGGSVEERIHVQSELSGIEEKIQELGVSLGDFDGQNELCTVKLTLEEAHAPKRASLLPMIVAALSWSALVYAGIAGGLCALTVALWALYVLAGALRRLIREA